MIKVYDKNRSFIKGTEDYKDIKIEEEQNLTSTLSFSIPLSLKDIFEEEGYIEVKNEGSFVIKEINMNIESISIVCKQDLEDLTSGVSNKAYVTKTMQYILNDLLQGTGWTGVADTNISRTVTGSNMSVLDYIFKAIDIFKYEVKFDSVNKKIIAKEKIGSDKGVYFHDEVNLKSTNISSDTYDFVTRIIPLGFEDMGIELINGGKSYVENHSYSNKIITLEWKDERYTVAENLKRDAALKLEKLCRPLRTYSCSIEDLSKSIEYSILSYEVGDTIDLIDREKGIREKQRITKTVKYLNNEGEDTVEIANRPRIFGEDLEDKIDEINSNISSTNSRLELLDDKIIAEVETINQSVMDNVKTINTKIGQLIITDSEISNMVSDLTTIVSDNYNEVNNKIGKLDIKADGINASVSNLNTKVDNNKTTTDNRVGSLEVTASNISTKVSRVETTADRAEGKADSASNLAVSAYSHINQTADAINLEVAKKVGKDNIISSFNLSTEYAKLSASKINLVGAVTILSNIAGDLGSITAGTLNIGGNAFRVASNGNLYAGNGGFSVPWNADGITNSFSYAARWKYNDYNYLFQNNDEVRFYNGGQSVFRYFKENYNSNWMMALGDGGGIKALSDNTQLQVRNRQDSAYIMISASDFNVGSSRTLKKNIKPCESKLELVKNTPIYNFQFKVPESTNDIETVSTLFGHKRKLENAVDESIHTGFIVEESPDDIITDLGDVGGISLTNTIGVLWKAVQELSSKVDVLETKVVELEDNKGEGD